MCSQTNFILPTGFMIGLIIIEILLSCDKLHRVTAVQVLIRACHIVPISFVLAMARLQSC